MISTIFETLGLFIPFCFIIGVFEYIFNKVYSAFFGGKL